MATKSLYIFVSNFNRLKIGISAHPEWRMAQIKSSSPIRIELRLAFAHYLLTPDALDAEKRMHWHFRPYRLHGEWFSISESEAIEAARIVVQSYQQQPDMPVKYKPANRYYAKSKITLARHA